jgi:cell wall-associated NlpC family hydrolase
MKKKLFALLFSLAITVIALSNNASAADTTTNTVLYQGMRSTNVTVLQSNLKTLGYFNYGPTGYFGELTAKSVIAYQRANMLTADGIVGKMTQTEIKNDKMLQQAKQYIGVPYAWGGTSPSGFDCSGFTQFVFGKAGVYIPRTSTLQYNTGYPISKDQLKSGDLVFFSTYKPGPSHVGIYIANNKFIAASSSQGVTITDMNNSYYQQRYIGARRITG